MLSLKKQEIAKKIEATIVRYGLHKGIYSYAIFTYKGNIFEVNKDGLILKNGDIATQSVVSNGRYTNITLGGSDSLMTHQIVALCLIEGCFSALLEDDDVVINHKTIIDDLCIMRQSKKTFIEQLRQHMFEGGDEPDYSLQYVYCEKDNSVDNLELCTNSENREHSAFIRTFDLFGIRISAKDIKMLKSKLIDNNEVERVINEYIKSK